MNKHEEAAKAFGKVIIQERKRLLMTQQQLADECELDIRTIQRLEKGESGMGLHALFAIAKAFNCKPSDLLIKTEELYCPEKQFNSDQEL